MKTNDVKIGGGGSLGKNKTTAQRAGGVSLPVSSTKHAPKRGVDTPRSLKSAITIALILLFTANADAETVTNSNGDESPGSFRQVVQDAVTGGTINFASGINSIFLKGEAVNETAVDLSIFGNAGGTTLDGAGTEGHRILGLNHATGDVLLENLVFQNATNRQTTEHNDIDYARGGAVAISGGLGKTMSIIDSRFLNNRIDAIADQTSGFGGAIWAGNIESGSGGENFLVVTRSEFFGNSVNTTLKEDSLWPMALASGGAIATVASTRITDSQFVDNIAYALGPNRDMSEYPNFDNAMANAFGGAIITDGATIENSLFQNNKALATGGAITGGFGTSDAEALGGAIYNTGSMMIKSSLFIGNEAVATGGETDCDPRDSQPIRVSSGALHLFNPHQDSLGKGVYIEDTSFLDNRAVAIQTTDTQSLTAEGGAIVIQSMAFHPGESVDVTLSATAGNQTVFRGNKEIEKGLVDVVERANSIVFVRYSMVDDPFNFLITTEQGGLVALDDPFRTTLSTTLDMTVEGEGEFRWGGENIIGTLSDTTVHFKSGTITLAPDFALIFQPGSILGNPGTVEFQMDSDVKLHLDLTGRNTQQAMFEDIFDYITETSLEFTVENGVALSASTYSLDEVNERHIITNNRGDVTASNFNIADDGLFTVAVSHEDLNLYVSIDNARAVAPILNSPSVNFQAIRQSGALNTVYNDTLANADPSDHADMFHAVRNNPQHLVPEALVSQGQVAFGSTNYLSQTLWQMQGMKKSYSPSAGFVSPCDPCGTAKSQHRFAWGGFVGNHVRQDDTGDYYGYKNSLNGGIFGIDIAATKRLELGAFIAFADGKTTYDSLASRVNTDVLQTGLYSTWQPNKKWSVRGDFSYGHFDNNSSRVNKFGRYTGSFDQEVYNVGLLAKRDFRFNNRTLLSPYYGLRYQHLKQDAVQESGPTGFAAAVDGFTADAFTGTLGAASSFDVKVGRRILTPTLYADWTHEFADRGFAATASYVGAPEQQFRLGSVRRSRDSFNLGFDVTASWKGRNLWEAHTGYAANLASDYAGHMYYATLGVRF